jgi:hypothetical protein
MVPVGSSGPDGIALFAPVGEPWDGCSMSNRTPQDVWQSRDLIVLRAIVTKRDERPGHPITSHDLARDLGMGVDHVLAAVQNLATSHIEIAEQSSLTSWDAFVTGVTESGLRAAGAWPSPEAAADRLIAALNDKIDGLPEDSPKQNRLKSVRDGLLGAGRDVLVEVAGAVLTGRIPV